jgi:hypothetical protein
MQMSRILYENATHWVCDEPKAYVVYRNGVTVSERRATIGKSLGLSRAIAEADKRSAAEAQTETKSPR